MVEPVMEGLVDLGWDSDNQDLRVAVVEKADSAAIPVSTSLDIIEIIRRDIYFHN